MNTQPPFTVRLPQATREQLEQFARADDRPVSALIRKILTEWLKRRGASRDR
jgi:predicted transcriptional regulator